MIQSSGGLSEADIEKMVKAAEQYAEQDKQKRVKIRQKLIKSIIN